MNNIEKKKKSFWKSKLFLFAILPLFVVMVTAGVLTYYALFSVSFTVQPSITLSGCEDVLGEVYDRDIIVGSECTITNNALTERKITLTDDSDGNVSVSYMGSLTMVEKDTATWLPVTNGITETIQYTVVGEKFIVKGIPVGYTLIYYPNTEGDVFATNVFNVKVLTEGVNVIGNLPIILDVGDNYCNNGFNSNANQCVGAKLWLILGDTETALAKLKVWDTTGFLFETDLIQYNSEGHLVLSGDSSLVLTPVYTIAPYVTGTYTITTTVA